MTEEFLDPNDYYVGKKVKMAKKEVELPDLYDKANECLLWEEACPIMINKKAYFWSGGALYRMHKCILEYYEDDIGWESSELSMDQCANTVWYKATLKKGKGFKHGKD